MDVAKRTAQRFLNAKKIQEDSFKNLTLRQVYLLGREFKVKFDFDDI